LNLQKICCKKKKFEEKEIAGFTKKSHVCIKIILDLPDMWKKFISIMKIPGQTLPNKIVGALGVGLPTFWHC
jgi:hypothetical protein